MAMKNKKITLSAILFLPLVFAIIPTAHSQPSSLGWNGNPIIPITKFTDTARWNRNYQSGTGDSCFVTAESASMTLHWKFSEGKRYKYAQCYQFMNPPISLAEMDIIGLDVRGSRCGGGRDVKIKFEDGVHQAAYQWNSLAGMTRWCERLSLLKSQFSNADNIDWNGITVISLEVCSDAANQPASSDSGTVSFRNLQADSIAGWPRADSFEALTDTNGFGSIKRNAVDAIVSRQAPTGLFYTWYQDSSSYLYGHGLTLKILSLEGKWENGHPADAYSTAAEKLAEFLIEHQDAMGFWPRAWHTKTGAIRQYLEQDSTIWFGDFPWPIIGLRSYYARSGDENAKTAINKAESFLHDLIEPDGKLNTINPVTHQKKPVTSCEAYAATILALTEIGDRETADQMMRYVDDRAWDERLKYWKEGTASTRIVLFANTWLAQIARANSHAGKACDALSLVGKALFTRGPGEPWGFDGIGPVAVWYEGTLSYICAGGPGSRFLFDRIRSYINPDGTVPHYNDNLGGMAGVWAVDWSSLDGTAWLYFAASGKSPFDQVVSSVDDSPEKPVRYGLGWNFPNPFNPTTRITYALPKAGPVCLKVLDIRGREVRTLVRERQEKNAYTVRFDATGLASGIYFFKLQAGPDFSDTRKMTILK
jgi:hypothetical protein